MPAEIEPSAFCADYYAEFEVPGTDGHTIYLVTFNGGAGTPHCRLRDTGEPCKGFKFRGDCRHIQHVFAHACLWNPQFYEGGDRTCAPTMVTVDTLPDAECPKCSGPMIGVMIAV